MTGKNQAETISCGEMCASRDVLIGTVRSVNFVARKVRIRPSSRRPERFLGMTALRIRPRGTREETVLPVEHAAVAGANAVVTVPETVENETLAKLKGGEIVVAEEERMELERDQYFVSDLIGLQVRDESGGPVGTVTDVIETKGHDIYQIECPDGTEALVAAVESAIMDIDVGSGSMIVAKEAIVGAKNAN